MFPVDFEEKTKVLQRPPDMTEKECSPLAVWNDGRECISKWQMTFGERLHCLFRGYVWLRVLSGHTQPPVSVVAEKTLFRREDNEQS